MAIKTSDIKRPPKKLIKALTGISAATAAGELKRMRITDPSIQGPATHNKGRRVIGPVLTLQFMPKCEDQHDSGVVQGPGDPASSSRAIPHETR